MWRRLATTAGTKGEKPGPRSSYGLSAIGQTLYLHGGEMVPRVPVDNHMYSYDLGNQKWSRLHEGKNAPVARVGPAMASIGQKLFVFGGRTGIAMGEGALDDLHVFDTATNSWEELCTKGDRPEARSYHSMVSNGERLFLFGGCGKERLNDLHCFEPSTAVWERLPSCDLIKPRGGAGLVHVDGSLYIIGGFGGVELNDMFKYSISTRSWEEIESVPNIPPISVFGHGNVKGNLVIFGGEVDPTPLGHAGAGTFSKALYVYECTNPERGWRKAEVEGDVPQERGWLSAAVTSGGSFVVYGGNMSSNERQEDMFYVTL